MCPVVPTNSFAVVTITTVPVVGSLTNNGLTGVAGHHIAARQNLEKGGLPRWMTKGAPWSR